MAKNDKKKDDKNKNKGWMEYCLEKLIPCGYLLQFCDTEHNAENLMFIMACEVFKKKYKDLDSETQVWPASKTWILIDAELSMKTLDYKQNYTAYETADDKWTHPKISRREMLTDVVKLFNDFFTEESLYEICQSKEEIKRTQFRILNLHKYGPEVFGEALVDPFKTMNKDIMPRFTKSAIYTEMQARMSSIDPLPIAITLDDYAPDESWVLDPEWMAAIDSHIFDLDDMLVDKYLYDKFLEYLLDLNTPEHLLCYRTIITYEALVKEGELQMAHDRAWDVYKYFLATGSAYNVASSEQARYDIKLSLCKKSKTGTFEPIRKTCYATLLTQFATFKESPLYHRLPMYMKECKAMVDKKIFRQKMGITK